MSERQAYEVVNLTSRCAGIISMDISTAWPKPHIHTWISIDLSMDIHSLNIFTILRTIQGAAKFLRIILRQLRFKSERAICPVAVP